MWLCIFRVGFTKYNENVYKFKKTVRTFLERLFGAIVREEFDSNFAVIVHVVFLFLLNDKVVSNLFKKINKLQSSH